MKRTPPVDRPVSMTALCLAVWLVGGLFLACADWLGVSRSQIGRAFPAGAAITGAAMILAGTGLCRMGRGGLILFGGLAILGSIHLLTGVNLGFPDLSSSSPAHAARAGISVLVGLIMPVG